MEKVYLIQAHYLNGVDEFFETKVSLIFEKAKEIFDELVEEELSTTYLDTRDDVAEFEASENEFNAFDTDNKTHIWIEEKEIEE